MVYESRSHAARDNERAFPDPEGRQDDMPAENNKLRRT
jgi:hypothetical protein